MREHYEDTEVTLSTPNVIMKFTRVLTSIMKRHWKEHKNSLEGTQTHYESHKDLLQRKENKTIVRTYRSMLDDNKFILKTHKLFVTASKSFLGAQAINVKVKWNHSEGTQSYFEHHTVLLRGYALNSLKSHFHSQKSL